MNPQAELERLLAETFDAPPDEARNQKLRELLHAHPELQTQYLEFVQLHALLQWRGGAARPPAEKPAPRRWRSARGLAAALMVMAASVAIGVFLILPDGQGAPDVVDRLIDWNLDIAQAKKFEERNRIYSQQESDLKATLASAELPQEDRSLADAIMDTSIWLTKNDEPVATAERYNEIAEKLVDRLIAATANRDETRIVKLADAYRRLADRGVEPSFVQAVASKDLDAADKKKLAQVVNQEETRSQRIEQMIERNPAPSSKALRRGIKGRHLPRLKKHMKGIR